MHEHRFIVPDADRTALLVVDGQLPVVRASERRRQPELLAALAEEHGIKAPFLRTIRWRDENGERSTLVELDTAQRRGHAQWLPVDTIDPEVVVPVFSDGVTDWLAEQRGGTIPPQRSPWARPGWLADASRWVSSVAPSAREPRLVRQWPLSAMYVFDSALGALFLKACLAIWPHEPALTALLAHEHPGSVPDVVAINEEHRWLLMRGVNGLDVADGDAERLADELRLLAELQRSWAGRTDKLLSLGVPRRPLAQLHEAAPDLGHLCARLDAFEVPETLTHGDVHQWNGMVVQNRVVILDWSDAAIAHPFLDLGAALFYAEEEHEREKLIDAYLGPWAHLGSLREAAAIGEALGCVYQAISFRSINAAFEPADRWLFAGEWDRWLTRANELAAAL